LTRWKMRFVLHFMAVHYHFAGGSHSSAANPHSPEGRASELLQLSAQPSGQEWATTTLREELWTQTLSFLARYSRESPRFEVALAMCLHFVPEGTASTNLSSTSSASSTLSSLFEVSQRHSQVVVGAQYLSGWCSQRSGHTAGSAGGASGGLGVKNADATRRAEAHTAAVAGYFAQAAAEGYAAAQYELALCYRHGNIKGGGGVDLEKAARLFERAAASGHS